MERVDSTVTPMMAQWHACKAQAKGAVLLFRMGDFYEAFYDDALLLSQQLDLTLTKRQEIPMAGVPHHSAESYIDRLVGRGYRVAIAEQVEDPKQAKGLVRREIVRFVTPGTVVDSTRLSDKANNFFCSLTQVGPLFGLATIDLTTSEFSVTELSSERELLDELSRLCPAELLTTHRCADRHERLLSELSLLANCLVSRVEEWRFDHQMAYEGLLHHFKVTSLDGFGLRGMTAPINAAGALLNHLAQELRLQVDHLVAIHPYATSESVGLDRTTQRNLELTHSFHEGGKSHTLLAALDRTRTPMGGRLLRQWIERPLLSLSAILQRQEAVAALVNHPYATSGLGERLSRVRDLERLTMRISAGFASPRDLVALAASLEEVPGIQSMLNEVTSAELLSPALDDLSEVASQIRLALVEDPPLRIGEGGIFCPGYNDSLDELQALSQDGKQWIADYQARVREETGIKTLRVGFNKVFGYFIEVSKGQADRVPDLFQRRQTLANCERFISPELKAYEEKVLSAEERLASLETELFTELRLKMASYAPRVLRLAHRLAAIDCLNSFATVARERGYVRPLVDEGGHIEIEGGRHPVIEQALGSNPFVPNDTLLNEGDHRLILITGPNMAGKSTYIRQVALIVLMAQIGSFVPATRARVGLVDKIFTRIGASDDLSRGQSTFMVEMTETANILHNATSRSLVILDEIGRGTSTYDGVSIAWSVAEYLLKTVGRQAKALFATHYFELTQLEGRVPGAVNYNVLVREWEDQILFLHKIVRGAADRSYGIQVGRLAGLPRGVIDRAQQILERLEKGRGKPATAKEEERRATQMLLFETIDV
jgi:DNA mismatch repair protein MutS